jgi:hypothetical protein
LAERVVVPPLILTYDLLWGQLIRLPNCRIAKLIILVKQILVNLGLIPSYTYCCRATQKRAAFQGCLVDSFHPWWTNVVAKLTIHQFCAIFSSVLIPPSFKVENKFRFFPETLISNCRVYFQTIHSAAQPVFLAIFGSFGTDRGALSDIGDFPPGKPAAPAFDD